MTAAAVLVVYALLMGAAGSRWLAHASWPGRSPRIGILVWLSLTVSIVLAVALAGMVLALSALPGIADLATFLHACLTALREHYQTPGGAVVSLAGAALTLLVVGRLSQVLLIRWYAGVRHRPRQRRELLLVAGRHDLTEVLVLPHPTPAAYCLPGRQGAIVFTTAALEALSPAETAAVLAHERAHLRGRHHLVLAAVEAVSVAFPFVPAFVEAQVQLARLVEMSADDVAVRTCQSRALAMALLRLAGVPVPVGAVGAGGSTAVARAQRLTNGRVPIGRTQTALTVALTLGLLIVPILIATGPALVSALVHYCPLDLRAFGL